MVHKQELYPICSYFRYCFLLVVVAYSEVMRCLLLAGGLGTRLGDLTRDTPKPLLKIGNRSVIEILIDRLNKHGIHEIIITTHYHPEKIMEVMGDKAIYYFEPILFSAQQTIKNLESWLNKEDFFVINSDTLNEIDYTEMRQVHKPGSITAYMDSEYRGGGS